MIKLRYGIWAALAIGAFLIVSNFAYFYLVTNFGYDDILREPVPIILENFATGGSALILAWTGFAWSALIFVLAACLLGRALAREHGQIVWMATLAGAASGVVQAAGLLRWVFVVPTLATSYVGALPNQQIAIVETFSALNQYGGVALGEHLGQILLVAWSVCIIAACWRAGGLLAKASIIGMLSIPLWIVGQTELFATVMPRMPVIEATPFAFLLWMIWLLALALALVFQRKSTRSNGQSQQPS